MPDPQHPAPCPGPDAHRTRTGGASCTGHVKASSPERAHRKGMPCTKAPVRGGTVCASHGGNAGQVRAAGQRRQQEAAAERAVATLGLSRTIDPSEALLEEVWRTAGHVDWLAQRVRDLEQDDMTWGTRRVKTGGDDAGTTQEAGPPVWYELYARERAHLVKVCAEAIKAGIEERRVRLAEQQGALLADVIRRILADLDLTASQQLLVGEVVPRHLRAIAGGGA